MVRKIMADGKKRTKTNDSLYYHNSYFFIDQTDDGVSDLEIAANISRMMSDDAGVPVDVVVFVEIDDADNKYTCPNDLVKIQESELTQLPVGAHRYVVCDEALFKEYMETGVDA